MTAPQPEAAALWRWLQKWHRLLYLAGAGIGAYLAASGMGIITTGGRLAALEHSQEAFRKEVGDSLRAINQRVVVMLSVVERVQFLLDDRCAAIIEGPYTKDLATLRSTCRRLQTPERNSR